MFKKTLPFRLLFMFLVYALALMIPIFMLIHQDSKRMVGDMEKIMPLSLEQREIHEGYIEGVTERFFALSFYIFILAFIFSLFFSGRFLMPVKELWRGARAIKEGDLDVQLEVRAEDELGEVTRAFNDMAAALRLKTEELVMKNRYVSAMLDPLWVVDMDNIIIDVNPAFTQLFGYERDDVVGSSVFDFLDEGNTLIMRKQLYARDAGVSSTYAISVISKKGELIPVLISGSPIIFEDGEVTAKIGIMKDFRKEISLREALKEAIEYREAIMDSMVDSLLVIDRDYRIVLANKAAVEEAGEDIIGKTCHSVYHKMPGRCAPHGIDCPAQIVFASGKSYRTVHEHVEKKGDKVFHEIIAYPVKDEKGNIKHTVEIMRDVTDKKRFEDSIAQKNKELTTLNGIAMMLNQSLRAEDIFNRVLDRIIEMTDMDGGGIFFLDDTGRELSCKYHRGLSEDFIMSVQRMRAGEDVPGRVAVTGQIFATSDISKDPRAVKSILRHTGIKAYSCFPVKGKERTLGVFYIFSFKPHIFTPEEERILQSVGEMTGIALENIRLYEKMRELFDHQRRRKAEEQKTLLGLSSLLATKLDINDVLDSTLSMVKQAFRADFIWLLQMNEEDDLLLSSSPEGGLSRGAVVFPQGTSSIERYAIEKKQPFILSNISAESRFYVPENISSRNYMMACSVPIYAGENSLGAFTLYYSTVKEPREEDIYFLQTVASMLYVAVERSRLFEEAALEKGMADTILNSITDGIITVDAKGRIISVNMAASRILKVPFEGIEGSMCCEVLERPEENTELTRRLKESLEDALAGKVASGEVSFITPERMSVPMFVGSAPVRDPSGLVTGAVYILRDISSEKEVERMKEEFVRAVSHEFRTPLSAIVGMAEMLIDGELDAGRSGQYLLTILDEGKRLSEMVTDLLDLAEIRSGKEVLRESDVDFRTVLGEIETEFGPALKKKDVKLSKAVKGDMKGFKGDREKLKWFLRNLIENSITYSDRGSSVDVLVEGKGDGIRLRVKDTGWGIPPEDIGHVAEKFYRGVHSGRVKGTGLGLSVCQEIVFLHKGVMFIESAPGEGTTVTVELPMRRRK